VNTPTRVWRHLALTACAVLFTAAAASADVRPDGKLDGAAAVIAQPGMSENGVRDEAMMVLVGALLIGLGTAVRRSA
jgi:hypothetical protein